MKEKLQAAFINEGQLRSSSSAPSSSPSHVVMQASSFFCSFCGLAGHLIDICHRFNTAKTQATKDAQQKQEERKNARKRAGKANAAQELASATSGASTPSEFAGKASLTLSFHLCTFDHL